MLLIEKGPELREHYPTSRVGRNGVEQGYKAHVLNAMQMLVICWEHISAQTVARCWLKSTILPGKYHAELATKYKKNRVAYKDRITPTQIVHLCGCLEGLKIGDVEGQQNELLIDVHELQTLFKESVSDQVPMQASSLLQLIISPSPTSRHTQNRCFSTSLQISQT